GWEGSICPFILCSLLRIGCGCYKKNACKENASYSSFFALKCIQRVKNKSDKF
ncbi:MAG: hypothetical protein JWQ40_326, partial [Segetibacter sp.]|nr:hypothetical protein [Segetibacter sp.]